jgi:hypothetical protein
MEPARDEPDDQSSLYGCRNSFLAAMEPARDEPDDHRHAAIHDNDRRPQWSRLEMSRTTAREKRAI